MTSSSPPAESPAVPTRRPALLRRWLPPLLGICLVLFVLSRLDFKQFWAAIVGIDHARYALFILVYNGALLLSDCFATRFAFAWTVAAIRYWDLVVLRAASYLPSLLNHHVGQAWLVYFLSRAYGVSMWTVAGTTLLIYGSLFACLCVVSAIALPFAGSTATWLGPLLGVVAALGVAYSLVIVRAPAWLRERPTFAALIRIGVSGHVAATLIRLPHITVICAGYWGAFHFFGISIPLFDALVVLPPLAFVSALPITPQGLGTREVAALQLVAPFAVGAPSSHAAVVTAASLVFGVSLTLLQAAASPLFMGVAMKRLRSAGATG